ncbi:hypothetical protein FBZ89_101430 [Nitrospirillum amazonense]|uniref:Uncharacterized protein n=1 Tax=Nitrospirillum amazonense TaxID=28077 RepID=A0A560FT41_9PROT|nr:hypothetical protein FBZ89_101430 [Nitrospirillum amazonense]
MYDQSNRDECAGYDTVEDEKTPVNTGHHMIKRT